MCKAELHLICVTELPGLPVTVAEIVEEKREANRQAAKDGRDGGVSRISRRVRESVMTVGVQE